MKRYLVRASALFFALFALLAWAQEMYQLGHSSLTRADGPYLQRVVDSTPGLFRDVGGVAFEVVATGRGGLQVTQLAYDPHKPDGRRLTVTLGLPDDRQVNVQPVIYDWELVPIARFAASEHGAAMTLFGSLDDKIFQEHVKSSGGRIINYHPALDNTLVGLRLMQADILLISRDAADLPRTSSGYLLGARETTPDLAVNRKRFDAVQETVRQHARRGRTFQSYVIGDLGQRVHFDLIDGALVFDGLPYWTMWRDPDGVQEARDALKAILEDPLLRNVIAQEARDGYMWPWQDLLRSLGVDPNQLIEHLETLGQWEAAGNPIVIDSDLSNAISDKIAAEDGINPVVYASLKNVMYFRALFRHALERDPAGYQRFLRSLDAATLEPEVFTPTVLRPTRLH